MAKQLRAVVEHQVHQVSSGNERPEGREEERDETTLEELARQHKKSRKAEKGVQILGKYANVLEEMDSRPADRLGFIQARLNEKKWKRQ